MDVIPECLINNITSYLHESDVINFYQLDKYTSNNIFIETIYDKYDTISDDIIKKKIMSRLKYLNYDNSLKIVDKQLLENIMYFSNEIKVCSLDNINIGKFSWITYLNISHSNIKYIPSIPSLKKLNCNWCTILKSIPLLPSLEELYCGSCRSLIELPRLLSLKKLDCNNCFILKSIPLLPLLEELDCNCCSKVSEIPYSPLLKKLNCNCCKEIVEIPILRLLVKLNCVRCNKITKISDLPLLKGLYCHYCYGLIEISDLPSLELLYCINNLQYDTPLTLSNVPSLRGVRYDGQHRISNISDYSSVIKQIVNTYISSSNIIPLEILLGVTYYNDEFTKI
jgi:hypothetical protein